MLSATLDGITINTTTEPILDAVNNYAIVPCANPSVDNLLFFYKDTAHPSTSDELPFFVQPIINVGQVAEWAWWGVPPPKPTILTDPKTIAEAPVVPQFPLASPRPELVLDPAYSLHQFQTQTDWLTQSATLPDYNGVLVDRTGRSTSDRIRSTVVDQRGAF